MRRHAISRQSVSAYVKQRWLERVRQGVYRRPFSTGASREAATGWKIPLLSAQWIMGHSFHVGGTSALSLHGHSHYLQLRGNVAIYLYGSDIPTWLVELQTDARLVRRSDALFGEQLTGVEDSEFSLSDGPDAELPLSPWRWPIRMSSAERAILEALDELPNKESFHTLDVTFESLVNMRPKLLTALLAQCQSVKVKRLFFVYADKHAHAWRKHIDMSRIDMGRGDRALAANGRLHPTYRITVPADLLPQEAANGA
ncbi:Transcriptional regulator, AbiEi antitoxin, Type IV TA system [Bosea lupini]|uniref:Transcriptional regulator, AbiEi antitoxin, Type IV TA system n=2 Tax=Bosea lupini TaxID=1036779 RepID=A0A1H7ZNK1_9HYPH|nr:Transcriptional regulator, AbiEi antitoxin, Type IV TA system [Bosea lupini]